MKCSAEQYSKHSVILLGVLGQLYSLLLCSFSLPMPVAWSSPWPQQALELQVLKLRAPGQAEAACRTRPLPVDGGVLVYAAFCKTIFARESMKIGPAQDASRQLCHEVKWRHTPART